MSRLILIILFFLLIGSCAQVGGGLFIGCVSGTVSGCSRIVGSGCSAARNGCSAVASGTSRVVKATYNGCTRVITYPFRAIGRGCSSGVRSCSSTVGRGSSSVRRGCSTTAVKSASKVATAPTNTLKQTVKGYKGLNNLGNASGVAALSRIKIGQGTTLKALNPNSMAKNISSKTRLFKARSRYKASSNLPKHLNKYEKNLIKASTTQKIAGRKVATNDKLFKVSKRSRQGKQNCDRMAHGLSPIGIDGAPVNLHHLGQQEDGVLVEILTTDHRANSSELHYHRRESEIDRSKFNAWKSTYWKERGLAICK